MITDSDGPGDIAALRAGELNANQPSYPTSAPISSSPPVYPSDQTKDPETDVWIPTDSPNDFFEDPPLDCVNQKVAEAPNSWEPNYTHEQPADNNNQATPDGNTGGVSGNKNKNNNEPHGNNDTTDNQQVPNETPAGAAGAADNQQVPNDTPAGAAGAADNKDNTNKENTNDTSGPGGTVDNKGNTNQGNNKDNSGGQQGGKDNNRNAKDNSAGGSDTKDSKNKFRKRRTLRR